jgi:hypothetical protein
MLSGKYKIFISLAVCFLSSFLFSQKVWAANLFWQTSQSAIKLHSFWEVSFQLDTQQEMINALEGQINFPVEQLDLVEIKDSNSLINFWLDKPRAAGLGAIKFSGIVPGGYSGQGEIFKLIFRTKKEGSGWLGSQQTRVLLNDGLATPAVVANQNLSFVIAENFPAQDVVIVDLTDREPPEPFTPILTKIPEIGGDNYLLIFSTQDKNSGLAYYEIKEGRWPFVKAESPYVLKNQKLNQPIIIRAFDQAGNERKMTIAPVNAMAWYEKLDFFAIILSVIVLGYILGRGLWRKRKQK